ncbi:MAG: DUF3098 domain-containing protein [Bacteroidales bacterium]|nr:DUF3098 domain-containing protein [Bacteroidales bacterium]
MDKNAKEVNVAEDQKGFVLEKKNYILIGVGFLLLIIGFILLSGGKSSDPAVYNPEIFSFRRITLAPIVILLGFITEIFAIVWKPKK